MQQINSKDNPHISRNIHFIHSILVILSVASWTTEAAQADTKRGITWSKSILVASEPDWLTRMKQYGNSLRFRDYFVEFIAHWTCLQLRIYLSHKAVCEIWIYYQFLRSNNFSPTIYMHLYAHICMFMHTWTRFGIHNHIKCTKMYFIWRRYISNISQVLFNYEKFCLKHFKQKSCNNSF